jgi:hypothetical protein
MNVFLLIFTPLTAVYCFGYLFGVVCFQARLQLGGPALNSCCGADADGFEKSGQAKVPNSVEINLRGSWRHRNEAPVALDLSGCAEK